MENKLRTEIESKTKTKIKHQNKHHISTSTSSSSSSDNDIYNNKQNKKQKSVHKIDYLSTQVSPTIRSPLIDLKKLKKHFKVIKLRVFPDPNSDLLKVPMDITFMIDFDPVNEPLSVRQDISIPIRLDKDYVNIPIHFEKNRLSIDDNNDNITTDLYLRIHQIKQKLSEWKQNVNNAELTNQIEQQEVKLRDQLFQKIESLLNPNQKNIKITVSQVDESLKKLENLLVGFFSFLI